MSFDPTPPVLLCGEASAHAMSGCTCSFLMADARKPRPNSTGISPPVDVSYPSTRPFTPGDSCRRQPSNQTHAERATTNNSAQGGFAGGGGEETARATRTSLRPRQNRSICHNDMDTGESTTGRRRPEAGGERGAPGLPERIVLEPAAAAVRERDLPAMGREWFGQRSVPPLPQRTVRGENSHDISIAAGVGGRARGQSCAGMVPFSSELQSASHQ